MSAVHTLHVKSLLPDYLTGQLDTGLREEVEVHLRDCPSCRGDYEEMRELVGSLRGHPRKHPSSSYFSNLLPRVRERLGRRGRFAWIDHPLIVRLVSPLAAAALIVILMLELPLVRQQAGGGEGGELLGMVEAFSTDDLSQIVIEQGHHQLLVETEQEITVPHSLVDRVLSRELSLSTGVSDPLLMPFTTMGGITSESLNALSEPEVDRLLQRLEERSVL